MRLPISAGHESGAARRPSCGHMSTSIAEAQSRSFETLQAKGTTTCLVRMRQRRGAPHPTRHARRRAHGSGRAASCVQRRACGAARPKRSGARSISPWVRSPVPPRGEWEREKGAFSAEIELIDGAAGTSARVRSVGREARGVCQRFCRAHPAGASSVHRLRPSRPSITSKNAGEPAFFPSRNPSSQDDLAGRASFEAPPGEWARTREPRSLVCDDC